jgi:hypothetical protein
MENTMNLKSYMMIQYDKTTHVKVPFGKSKLKL